MKVIKWIFRILFFIFLWAVASQSLTVPTPIEIQKSGLNVENVSQIITFIVWAVGAYTIVKLDKNK